MVYWGFNVGTNMALGFASVPLTSLRPKQAYHQIRFLRYIYNISSILKDHNGSFMVLFPFSPPPFLFASLPFQRCMFY